MYHSISFGDGNGHRLNTWETWGLIPNSRPAIAPPPVKTHYIDIPGGGRLDYTEVLTGAPAYGPRTGSWEFTVTDRRGDWVDTYSDVLAKVHGKRTRIILDDDPGFFYDGRVMVNDWKSQEYYSSIVLDYDVEPYKYAVAGSSGEHDWLWDDLFSNIIYYGTFDVSGSVARNLINPSDQRVTPKFTCSAPITASFVGGGSYSLPAGTTASPGFSLAPGDNQMTFSGTGRVYVDYSLGQRL